MKETNSYLVFADEEDEAQYVQSGGTMGNLILSEIKMADSGIDFKARTITPTTFSAAFGQTTAIEFTWSSFDKSADIDTGEGTVILRVAGRVRISKSIQQGNNSINVTPFFKYRTKFINSYYY